MRHNGVKVNRSIGLASDGAHTSTASPCWPAHSSLVPSRLQQHRGQCMVTMVITEQVYTLATLENYRKMLAYQYIRSRLPKGTRVEGCVPAAWRRDLDPCDPSPASLHGSLSRTLLGPPVSRDTCWVDSFARVFPVARCGLSPRLGGCCWSACAPLRRCSPWMWRAG